MKKKKFYIRLSIFALNLILGVIFGVLSNIFSDDIPINIFSKTLHYKENIAEKKLQTLKNQIVAAQKQSNDIVGKISPADFENQDIFYYVVENGNLIYWSDNQLDIKSLDFSNLKNNSFVQLSNASCLLKNDTLDNLHLLALIKIKNNYGVDNKYVASDFAYGFLLDNSIGIALERSPKTAVFTAQGDYVFSLVETRSVNHNKILLYLHTFFLFLAFVFYGLLFYNLNEFFGAAVFKIKNFVLLSVGFAAVPLLMLLLKTPSIFFKHRIFSPLLYSDIIPSLGHLLIITLVVAFVLFTFYYKVFFDIKRHKILSIGIFQTFFAMFFMLIMKIIHSIIHNSTLEVFSFPPRDNEVYSVIALIVAVLWFLIFCFAYRKFIQSIQQFVKLRYLLLLNALFSLILFVSLFLAKYENYLLFSVAYFLLASLICLFTKRKNTAYPLIDLSIICYAISIFIVYYTVVNQQDNQIHNAEVIAENVVSQVDAANTDFLDKDFMSPLQKFSSALYQKNHLIYESGAFPYPMEYNFHTKNVENMVNSDNYIHYIFGYDNDLQVVVSCKQMNLQNTYILNLSYIIVVFVFFIFLIKLLFKPKNFKAEKSITDNLQKAFIYIIVVALSIVVVSITIFTYREYSEMQKRDLETKIKYISVDVKDFFAKNQYGSDVDLTKFINILSHKYETDIQIYNADGKLLISSRPYVFVNKFVSELINPDYFFGSEKNAVKVENIGKLNFFAIYSALLDADKNIIAYIEVPVFFSVEQLRSETILYIAAIANIFFLILVTVILLNFWLSSRITLSISKIEKSLKNIAVGEKNLKMEVKESGRMDEIEKLMLQYNCLVDELEKNTKILLENERNFAWRDMAKQIAHEIKNPLTPMKLSIQQLQRIKEVKPEEFDKYFNNMSSILIEQIDNLSKIASSFSNFAKIQTENFEKIDITQKLFSAVELFKNNTKNIDIFYKKPPEPIFVNTDNEQIIEVFNNIFRNAIQAIPNEKSGKIAVSSTLNSSGVLIAISDNGSGISDDDGKNIFMPNFSTKSSGTGLGLSIVKHIIEVSNGKIWFSSKLGEGTTFFIQLPCFQQNQEPRTKSQDR